MCYIVCWSLTKVDRCILPHQGRVVRQTYSNCWDRCFAAAGPKLWNSLPTELRQADNSFQRFKRLLKIILFGCWDCGTLWLTVVKAVPHKFSSLPSADKSNYTGCHVACECLSEWWLCVCNSDRRWRYGGDGERWCTRRQLHRSIQHHWSVFFFSANNHVVHMWSSSYCEMHTDVFRHCCKSL